MMNLSSRIKLFQSTLEHVQRVYKIIKQLQFHVIIMWLKQCLMRADRSVVWTLPSTFKMTLTESKLYGHTISFWCDLVILYQRKDHCLMMNALNEESIAQLSVRMLILRHCGVYLLKSCLWGPPVASWVTPALHPRRAWTCEQSHANRPLTHSLEMSKHIFSPFYPRGSG